MRLKDANERELQPLNRVDPHEHFIDMLQEASQNLRPPAPEVQPLNRIDPQKGFIEMLQEAGQNLRSPDYRVERGVIIIDD